MRSRKTIGGFFGNDDRTNGLVKWNEITNRFNTHFDTFNWTELNASQIASTERRDEEKTVDFKVLLFRFEKNMLKITITPAAEALNNHSHNQKVCHEIVDDEEEEEEDKNTQRN